MLDRSECQKPASRMTFRGIRSSKFRHVYGSPAKRQKCYDNVKISKSTTDSNLCAVNPKFLAVVIEVGGGGSFIVVPINETGRVGHHVSKVYFCSLKYLISECIRGLFAFAFRSPDNDFVIIFQLVKGVRA